MKIRVVDSIENLLCYKPEWEDMLREANNDILFLELDWIVMWWKHFGDKHKLFVLIVSNDQEITGICPLMITKKRFHNKISFIGGRQSARMDFIVKDKYREETVAFIYDFIRSMKGKYIIDLEAMPEKYENHMLLKKLLRNGKVPSVSRSKVFYILDVMVNDFETHFENRFGKRARQTISKKEKKLQSLGNLYYKKITDSEIDKVFEIHEKRWSRKVGNSSFSKGKTKEFYKALASNKSLNIETTVDAIVLNDKIISFIYGFKYNNKYYFIRIAHDDDFYFLSPGELVLKRKVQECFSTNITAMDFGAGYEPYKARWTDVYEKASSIVFPSKNLKSNLIFYALYWTGMKTTNGIRRSKIISFIRRHYLGKLKFFLSKNYLLDNALRIKRGMSKYGLMAYVYKCFDTMASNIWSYKKYQILVKSLTNDETPQNEMHVRETSIDDLDELSDLMNVSPENIIRRFVNKHRCFITLYKGDIIHYCWVNHSGIHISGCDTKIPVNKFDAYMYESYIIKDLKNEYYLNSILSSLFSLLYKDNFKRCYISVNSRSKTLEYEIFKKVFKLRYKVHIKRSFGKVKHEVSESV